VTTILVVDDEANVLSGLRRVLRSARKEWEIAYAADGEEALALFDSTRFDIVLSDIRMPKMDGITLLEEVRRRSPETVRIALSGHADKEDTLRGARHIHQFLSKPCAAETLLATLERAVRLGRLLQDNVLKALASSMESLPSLPVLYDNVVHSLESPTSSLAEVGAMISRDIGMSAKVLQLVNSAFFGLPQQVTSPSQAAILLGLDNLKVLVLGIRIFDHYHTSKLGGLELDELWNHSVDVARLAKRLALAETADDATAEYAFLGGLFHDVGKLVMAANLPGKYRSVLRLAGPQLSAIPSIERRVIGCSHGAMGGYLMGLWGFAEQIIDTLVCHHEPSLRDDAVFTPLTAVHVANALHHSLQQAGGAPPELDMVYLERMGKTERIPLWEKMACQTIGEKSI